jgi:hemolysin D
LTDSDSSRTPTPPPQARAWQEDTASLQQGKQWSSSLIWLSAALFGGTLVWALLGKVDQTVTVRGRLEPAGSVREVDIPSGGVVRQVLIREGQQVRVGQPLLTIEAVGLNSRSRSLRSSISVLAAQQGYLSSLLNAKGSTSISFQPPQLDGPVSQDFRNQLTVAERQADQLLARFKQISIREESQKQTLILDQRIASDLLPLYRVGGVGRINYLTQLNKVQESRSQLASLAEEREKLLGDVAAQLTQVTRERQAAAAELDGLNEAIGYRTLVAPIAGKVFDLKAAKASVVSPDQVLLKLVPSNRLQATVDVGNADIGFLRLGMPVDVSVDSFPAGEFGYIKGRLTRIGADALPPDKDSAVYRFPATVSLDQQTVVVGKSPLNLQSGMSVTANINIRSRPVISLVTDMFTKQMEGVKRFR